MQHLLSGSYNVPTSCVEAPLTGKRFGKEGRGKTHENTMAVVDRAIRTGKRKGALSGTASLLARLSKQGIPPEELLGSASWIEVEYRHR